MLDPANQQAFSRHLKNRKQPIKEVRKPSTATLVQTPVNVNPNLLSSTHHKNKTYWISCNQTK